MSGSPCAAFVCGLLFLTPAIAAADPEVPAASAYRIEQRFTIGGSGGWDYLTVDAQARRLYVARSDRVMVLDADSGHVLGEIAHTDGVHGVALAPGLGRGFSSNGKANSVSVFDLKTLKTLDTIKVSGENPDAILYDASTQRVFTFNGRSANATAIDAATGKPLGTIVLSGKPEFSAADGAGRIFVNIEDRAELAVIDARTLQVVATWSLAPCEEPTGLALDAQHRRLFSVCQNQRMIVLDSVSGKQVASVPIGDGPDAAAFDAERQLVFSSNGGGTVTIVHEDTPDHFTVVDNIATQKSARTMALDAKTHRIFLAAAEFGAAPAATPEQPRPRPPMVPDSFAILVIGR